MFDIKECDNEMKATITAFSNDLKNIRTGRVSPEILKSIIIDSYGSKMPLTQLSNINNLDNMTLSINIWDASLTKIIEKNILESNLGATPQTDGNTILLKFPELTAERRKDLVKIISETSEKFKVSIRNIRRDANQACKESQSAGEISEDDLRRMEDLIQKETDKFIGLVDSELKAKESDLLEI